MVFLDYSSEQTTELYLALHELLGSLGTTYSLKWQNKDKRVVALVGEAVCRMTGPVQMHF